MGQHQRAKLQRNVSFVWSMAGWESSLMKVTIFTRPMFRKQPARAAKLATGFCCGQGAALLAISTTPKVLMNRACGFRGLTKYNRIG